MFHMAEHIVTVHCIQCGPSRSKVYRIIPDNPIVHSLINGHRFFSFLLSFYCSWIFLNVPGYHRNCVFKIPHIHFRQSTKILLSNELLNNPTGIIFFVKLYNFFHYLRLFYISLFNDF